MPRAGGDINPARRSAGAAWVNDSADPRVRGTVRMTPFRLNVTATRAPGSLERTASSNAVALPIYWPPNLMITSPGRRPARAAGPPGRTGWTPSARARAICAPLPR